MNNGIFVQDIYGKTGFENSLPKPLLGSTNVIPTPYHFTPSTEWSINYNNLVMVVDTSLITSPVISFLAGGGSATPWSIDWGDGYVDNFSSYNNTSVSHSYSQRGIFIIQIRGNMSAPKITTNALIRILSFGTFSTSASYLSQGGFNNNINLIDIPNNIPSTATSLQSLFLFCNKLNDTDLSLWNTSNITNMGGTFEQCNANQNLGFWDTSKVTTFASMFKNVGSFNNAGLDSINNWNTSSATSMNQMFFNSSSFNQPLNNWNVRKVTDFTSMFQLATTFNSSLSGWQLGLDTAGTNSTSMFELTNFNQPINDWNTSKVTNMSRMFRANTIFNQPLNSWNTSLVNNMSSMFNLSFAFNQNIGSWNVGSVTDMNGMFGNALAFNNNGSVDINNWNTSNVTNMSSMFFNASSFNQPLNNWNVRKVTTFASMFQGATSFNSSLSGWALGADTTNVNAENMFVGASVFNQNIGNWDVSKVTSTAVMFQSASQFNNGGNSSISGWNTSNVNNMNNMFWVATSFNQPIGSWNVGNVTTMVNMFRSTASFNQNLDTWNVSKVRTMTSMFEGANAFQGNISTWNLAGFNVNTALDSFMANKSPAYSTTNYDALLIGWNNNKLAAANGVANWRTDLRPHFGGAKYTAGGDAAAARAALVAYGWTITDGGVA